jgi:hypothetical protein
MKKQAHNPRYPKTLMSLQHLEGGIYGTLSLVARDPNTLEIRLGADFVRVTPDVASQMAESCARFAGRAPVEVVVATAEVEEDFEETEEEEPESEPPAPRLVRPKRAAKRRPIV